MKTQQDWDSFYMDIATRVSQQSQEPQGKYVGCVIVRDGNILSFSYNGTLRPDNKMRDANGNSTEDVLHAEAGAIAKAARLGTSLADATLYCTHVPCIGCAQLSKLAGIKRIVWRDTMKKSIGTLRLLQMGFAVHRSINDHSAECNLGFGRDGNHLPTVGERTPNGKQQSPEWHDCCSSN